MSPPMERLQILSQIEKEIITCMQSAGQALLELSKEKSSQKQAESHTHQFLKTLSQAESKLSDQINYLTQVSTGQPHEGSGYASQKVLQMAWHRLEHARITRLKELEAIKNRHMGNRASGNTSANQNARTNNIPSTSVPTTNGVGPSQQPPQAESQVMSNTTPTTPILPNMMGGPDAGAPGRPL